MFENHRGPFKNFLLLNPFIVDAQRPEGSRGSIRVRHGVITEIGNLSPEAGEQVWDLTGKVLIPGLIDAHVHLFASTMSVTNDHLFVSELACAASRIMEGMLRRGFTAVRDAGGADFGLVRARSQGLISGPRLFISGRALSPTGGHGDFRAKTAHCSSDPEGLSGSHLTRLADGVASVQVAARDELRRGASQIKIMASGGVMSPEDKISDLGFSFEEIRAIVQIAEDHGTYVMAHAHNSAAIQRACEAGVRTIEHGTLLTETAAKIMKAHNVFLVPTLSVAWSVTSGGHDSGLDADTIAKGNDIKRHALESLQTARRLGVRIGFGTDLLGMKAHQTQYTEFELRSQVESAAEIMSSATRENATILQMENRLGIIAPHAEADLLVMNENPFQDVRALLHSPPLGVICEGVAHVWQV